MAVVLDAGALIAIEQRDRRLGALLRIAQQQFVPVRTSTVVVAQVWRGGARQANLARVLAGVEHRTVDEAAGRRIGLLLAASRMSDVVDGHVAVITAPGDIVLTSDVDDITRLLDAYRTQASVVGV